MSLVGFVMIIVVIVILLSEPSLIMAAGVNHNNVSYIVINVFLVLTISAYLLLIMTENDY